MTSPAFFICQGTFNAFTKKQTAGTIYLQTMTQEFEALYITSGNVLIWF
jgi:hypothetical protein